MSTSTLQTNTTSVDELMVSAEILRISQFAICTFVCQAISIFGVVANVVNMVVFVKIGFKDTVNISLFALAISDFFGCLFLVWFNLAMTPWFHDLDDDLLPFDPVQTSYLTASCPHVICTRITGVITAFIALERCLCVRMPLKIKEIFTPRRVAVFNVLAYVLTVACFVPILMVNKLKWVYFPERNQTLIGLYFTEDRNRVESINFPIVEIFYPLVTFFMVTVCTALLVSSLRAKAKWRESATTTTASAKSKSSDMSSKEMRIATMVYLISIIFIVCFLPVTVVTLIKVLDTKYKVSGTQSNVFILAVAFIFFLESINSSINIFIYYKNSSNYRNMFNQIFGRKVGSEQAK